MPYIGKAIVHSESGGTGSALENLNLRLSGLYGPMSMLKINSNEDGTTVRCAIPYRTQSDEGGQLI